MEHDRIFGRLWNDYSSLNPSVNRINSLLKSEGEEIVNDHIALRTLDDPAINIDVLATAFIRNGYEPAGEYFFREKNLFAKHYEIPGNNNAPRIFISELMLEKCSAYTREIFSDALKKADRKKLDPEKLIFAGSIFDPVSHEVYENLRRDSEYAAWFYVFGFRANHFTVSINALKKYDTIVKVTELLKSNGFIINRSGGEIKGTHEDHLQQSSTMADLVKIRFSEGEFEIPACYYEFAQRYPDQNGKIYSGFIAKSADKIFESTNLYYPGTGEY